MTKEQLPSTSGMRGGGTSVPVVTQPGTQDAGPSALEQSLGALPQALQQEGALLQQTEELKAHRAKAFDTLNGNTAGVKLRIPMQSLDAQLLQADYQTYPEELDKQGHTLITEHGKTLSPGARAIFTKDAEEYLSVLHGRAEDERRKRMEQESAHTTSQKLYQAQDDYANAGNDYEREVALGNLKTFTGQMVAAGLLGGSQAATIEHKTVENAVKDRALTRTRIDPVGAYVDLRGIDSGKAPQYAEFRNLPKSLLPDLLTDAERQMHAASSQKEQDRRLAEAQTHQRQNANAITLRNETMSIVPTPNNMAAIQVAKQHILEAGARGELSEPLHATLTNMVAQWEEKARTYTAVDDEPTKRHLLEVLTFATEARDLDAVNVELYHAMPQLTGDTIHKIGQDIESRRGSLFPLNRPMAKAGTQLILDTVAPGFVTFGGMGTNFMDVEEKTRLANTIRTYQDRIMGLDAPHIDREGMQVARDVLKEFYEVPLGLPTATLKQMSFLPLPFRRGGPNGKIIPTREMGIDILRKLKVPSEQAGYFMRQYDTWRASTEAQTYINKEYPELATPAPPLNDAQAGPSTTAPSRENMQPWTIATPSAPAAPSSILPPAPAGTPKRLQGTQ